MAKWLPKSEALVLGRLTIIPKEDLTEDGLVPYCLDLEED